MIICPAERWCGNYDDVALVIKFGDMSLKKHLVEKDIFESRTSERVIFGKAIKVKDDLYLRSKKEETKLDNGSTT